jgi:nucleoside 2-deoxyribosyltransferase
MSEGLVICPICRYNQNVVRDHFVNDNDTESCECPVCGKYTVSFGWSSSREHSPPDRKLSAWIREENESGRYPELTKRRIDILLAGLPDYRPSEKQLKLLKAIERRSHPPGELVRLNSERDFPLAYSTGSSECAFYLRALEERGLLKRSTVIWNVTITSDGWDYLDKHASDLEEKTQAFVGMSFSDEMKPIWQDAIKPAIQKAGYTAYRVDEEPHSENIVFKIMAEIKDSRFVVADLTEQNNGVYFEAGYGLGLGLPIIWSIRKDDVDNLHFDTAQYNQIRWESAEELEEALFDYISAIVGKRSQAQR